MQTATATGEKASLVRVFPKPAKRRKNLTPLWFLLPSLVIFAIFAVWPTIELLLTSLSRYNLTDRDAHPIFIGLANYEAILADTTFWADLLRSFEFVLVSVVGSLLLGFYIATILNKVGPGKGLFRVAFLVPMAVSPAITALSFKFMFNYEFGVINLMLNALTGSGVNFLGDPTFAIWTTVGIDIWEWTPLVVLILVAGLESLPDEQFEAASLDGAGSWALTRYITIPLMTRFILIAALIRTMDAFRVYETIQLTTAGGPGNLSETLNILLAKTGFSYFEMGPASAQALILTAIIIFVGTVFLRESGAFREKVAS